MEVVALGSTNGLTINGGILDLNGTSISVPSLNGTAGEITNNGVSADASLTVNDNSSCSFAGIIQNGTTKQISLIKARTGVLTLTGANIYTGVTTISSGTLQIGNGGAGGSVVGNIDNESTLEVNCSDDWTYAGSISGAGALTKVGSGQLTLSNTNTYTGNTIINQGTLELSPTGELSPRSHIEPNASGIFLITGGDFSTHTIGPN